MGACHSRQAARIETAEPRASSIAPRCLRAAGSAKARVRLGSRCVFPLRQCRRRSRRHRYG
jgi:hypothetical protein